MLAFALPLQLETHDSIVAVVVFDFVEFIVLLVILSMTFFAHVLYLTLLVTMGRYRIDLSASSRCHWTDVPPLDQRTGST